MNRIDVMNITPLSAAYSTRTLGSLDTGERVIPSMEPIVAERRNRDETMLRIDFGAFVYAYSMPAMYESISDSAVIA